MARADFTLRLGLEGYAQIVTGFQSLITLATGVARKIAETAAQVADYNDVISGHEVSIERAQRATAGLISTMTLHRSAAEMEQRGLRITGQEYQAVASRALAYARATGTDANDAMEHLSDALMRGTSRGLRPFGIELGKTATGAATTRAALEQLTAEYGNQTTGVQDLDEGIQQLRNSWDRAWLEMGNALMAQSGPFSDILGSISAALDDISNALGTERGALANMDEFTRASYEASSALERLNTPLSTMWHYISAIAESDWEVLSSVGGLLSGEPVDWRRVGTRWATSGLRAQQSLAQERRSLEVQAWSAEQMMIKHGVPAVAAGGASGAGGAGSQDAGGRRGGGGGGRRQEYSEGRLLSELGARETNLEDLLTRASGGSGLEDIYETNYAALEEGQAEHLARMNDKRVEDYSLALQQQSEFNERFAEQMRAAGEKERAIQEANTQGILEITNTSLDAISSIGSGIFEALAISKQENVEALREAYEESGYQSESLYNQLQTAQKKTEKLQRIQLAFEGTIMAAKAVADGIQCTVEAAKYFSSPITAALGVAKAIAAAAAFAGAASIAAVTGAKVSAVRGQSIPRPEHGGRSGVGSQMPEAGVRVIVNNSVVTSKKVQEDLRQLERDSWRRAS